MIFLVNTQRHSEVIEDEIDSVRCTIDAGYNNPPKRSCVVNKIPVQVSTYELYDLIHLGGFL